jgi:hypothetical protein
MRILAIFIFSLLCSKVQAQPKLGSFLVSGSYGYYLGPSHLKKIYNQELFNTQAMDIRLGAYVTNRTILQLYFTQEYIIPEAINDPFGVIIDQRDQFRFRDTGFGILIRPNVPVNKWLHLGIDIGPTYWRRVQVASEREVLSGASLQISPVVSFYLSSKFGIDIRFIRIQASSSITEREDGYFSSIAGNSRFLLCINPGPRAYR